MAEAFAKFPDTWGEIHDQELAYFKYSIADASSVFTSGMSTNELLDLGVLSISPVIYEDFLPVSAAGIFQSNLGDDAQENMQAASSQDQFEAALGCKVANEFALYEAIQSESLSRCLAELEAVRSAS